MKPNDEGTLESLYSAAKFPILMANIYDAEWEALYH
jgi:2',3'-cyclic-nucleotide 2'-phosphodiesterase (5'-nucleotidase family)